MRCCDSLPRRCAHVSVFIALCAVALTVATLSASAKNKKSEAAQTLLNRAVKVTDIQAAGSQPFLLIAKTSWTQYGKTTNGQFALAWQSPSHYRREMTLPGFVEATVVDGDVLYRARNVDFVPLAALRSASLLGISESLKRWPTDHLKIVGPPSTTQAIPNYQCVSAMTEFNRASIQHFLCVDRTTGVPLSEEDKFSSGGTSMTTYRDYSSIRGQQFPLDIEYQDSAGAHGEFRIVTLNAVANFPKSTFQRPAQSIAQQWCAEPQVIDPLQRNWGLNNWRKWNAGPMVVLDDPLVFVTVSAKGQVQEAVLLGDSSNADKEAVARLRRDSLPVEKCRAEPIPYEIVLTLSQMLPY